MPDVRRLNELGVSKFADYLSQVKESGQLPQVSSNLLNEAETSEPIGANVDVESKVFPDRMAAGEYLCNVFSQSGPADIARDPGVWAWLSLFYFDQLCKRNPDGTLNPKELARWIPLDSSFRYYRHLLGGPYLIYRAFQDAPDCARIILCQPLHTPGDFVGQLAARQEFVRNRAVIGAATLLYFDKSAGYPKRGSSPKEHRPGTLRRFVDVINQYDLTWDLFSISGEELVGMLPSEFDPYKPPHLRRPQ